MGSLAEWKNSWLNAWRRLAQVAQIATGEDIRAAVLLLGQEMHAGRPAPTEIHSLTPHHLQVKWPDACAFIARGESHFEWRRGI